MNTLLCSVALYEHARFSFFLSDNLALNKRCNVVILLSAKMQPETRALKTTQIQKTSIYCISFASFSAFLFLCDLSCWLPFQLWCVCNTFMFTTQHEQYMHIQCRKLMTMTPKHRLILPCSVLSRAHSKKHRESHIFFDSDKSHEILPFVRFTNKQKTLQTSPQMKTFNINSIRSSLKWFIII